VRTHGGLTGGKEQGTGNREASSAVADGGFTEFWANYPRKVSKPDAERAWTKATKATNPATILVGLTRHLPKWANTEAKFIPHPATWLNGQRWADDLDAAPPADEWAAPAPKDWAAIRAEALADKAGKP
jgi:hypothetical protein